MMDDDLDLSLSPLKPRPVPRGGRRAAPAPSDSLDEDLGAADDLLFSPDSPTHSRTLATLSPQVEDRPVKPPRSRRTGGWADEISSGKARKSIDLAEEERFKDPPVDTRFDSDEEVPVIPDLEEVQEEDMAAQVALAPSVSVNRVATYKELDNDLFRHAAFATLDDIDLRLLTKCMSPEQDIKESDSVWNWDIIFTEISSQLNQEMNLRESSAGSSPRN